MLLSLIALMRFYFSDVVDNESNMGNNKHAQKTNGTFPSQHKSKLIDSDPDSWPSDEINQESWDGYWRVDHSVGRKRIPKLFRFSNGPFGQSILKASLDFQRISPVPYFFAWHFRFVWVRRFPVSKKVDPDFLLPICYWNDEIIKSTGT